MNKNTICRLTFLPLLAAVALSSACSKQNEPAGHSENDGHDHGKASVEDHSGHDHAKTNAPAPDDHTGHNHGPGEHTNPPAR
jgi:hypothetical protein